MSEYFFDSLVRQSNSEKEIQALRVKLPFMDNFCPVLEVKEIREEPDFLLIRIASESYMSRPIPDGDALPEGYVQNFFVHKSQAIFRTLERYPEPAS